MPVSEGITIATVLKAAPALLKCVSVIVAGSGAGTINDCATTGAAAGSNAVAGTPQTIGNQVFGDASRPGLRCGTGLVVTPGSGQTITVEWE